jgi:hypothetical protein
MTIASESLGRTVPPTRVAERTVGRTRTRRWGGLVLVLLGFLLVWEAAKWLGGDPWRLHGTVAGIQVDYEHVPPFQWRIADDLSLPHVWDIGRAFVDPAQRGGAPLVAILAGQAVFTFGEALAGFALGGLLGLGLGILFVHSRLTGCRSWPWPRISRSSR